MRASTGPRSDCCLFMGVDKVVKDGVVKSLFLTMRQSVQNILPMASRRLSVLYLSHNGEQAPSQQSFGHNRCPQTIPTVFFSKHSYVTVGRSEPWCIQQTHPEQSQGVCYDWVGREVVPAGEEVSWDDDLRSGSSFGFAKALKPL